MKKIKILALIMVVCLSVFVGGCGKDGKNGSEVGADLEDDTIPYEQDKDDAKDKSESDNAGDETDGKAMSVPADAAGVQITKGDTQTGSAPEVKKPVEKSEAKGVHDEGKSAPVKSEPAKPEPAPAAKPAAPVQKYKDGTFTGSAKGYVDNITVSVVLKGDVIKSVSITAHKEDEPYISDAKGVISKIVSAQSADVDAVAGATYRSNGIKGAVKAALASAKN